ncbi:MAG: type II secretion system protein [Coriobacteriia bacterium]|nr:type II secretion system protein [Coriobacteriia bacterium]
MAGSAKAEGACTRLRQVLGFTLQELLLVVAILGILAAVALPAGASMLKNLHQMDMDAKAETIYTAAQNELTKLQSAGDAGLASVSRPNADGVVKKAPGDSGVTVIIADGQLYFATNANGSLGTAAAALIQSVDEELQQNHWVVEYDYSSASVYAVFYAEDADQLRTYATVVGEEGGNDFDVLRDRDARLAQEAKVGYFAGGVGEGSGSTALEPTIAVTNQEKLTVDISSISPSTSSAAGISFDVTLTDGKGHGWTSTIAGQRTGRSYTADLSLDDLSRDSTRFVNTYGDANWLVQNGWKPQAGTTYQDGLAPGTELAIAVKARMSSPDSSVKESAVIRTVTNSLFGYESDANGAEAQIGFVRHLQNLDQSSGVDPSVTSAFMTCDLDLSDDASTEEDWASVYANGYFNGLAAEGVHGFRPIHNPALSSFDGKGFRIKNLSTAGTLVDGSATGNAALFGQVESDLVIRDLQLYRCFSRSAADVAAALVAQVSAGTLTVESCGANLADVVDGLTDDGYKHTDSWTQGRTVTGGLVGHVAAGATVSLGRSYAAGVAGSLDGDRPSASTGGLVGRVDGTVTVSSCYADSYLYGTAVGGLVGLTSAGATVNLESSYAAGFLASTRNAADGLAAGLVAGRLSQARSCYSVCSYLSPEGYEPGEEYAADKTASAIDYTVRNLCGTQGQAFANCYYVDYNVQDVPRVNNATGADARMGSDVSGTTLARNLNQGGTSGYQATGTAVPYNAMGQALGTTYPYAVLADVESSHFGDWGASFQAGSLVYFEHYRADDSYGFYGANVTSTLRDGDGTVVDGDGYGVVFAANGQIPDQISVTISGTDGTRSTVIRKSDAHHTVRGKNGASYVVYPLKDESVRTFGYANDADKAFFLSVQISSMGSQTSHWFFNPHFAKTVEQAASAQAAAPEPTYVRLRTARHLNNLSRWYANYAKATQGKTFYQERGISYATYNWTGYTDAARAVSSQEPVGTRGTKTVPFAATYDGHCNVITGLSIESQSGNDLGLFAQNAGTLKNVVLVSSYDPDASAASKATVRRDDAMDKGAKVNLGVLAGTNLEYGTIANCATAGYYLAGARGRLNVYGGSTVYAGGLVGQNQGSISRCAANTPLMTVNNNASRTYAAGFVGLNTDEGAIANCYAVGSLKSVAARSGSLVLGGFAGRNQGRVSRSYCATALSASGDCSSYGFAPQGSMSGCSFLNDGVYSYAGATGVYSNDKNPAASRSYEAMLKLATSKASAQNSLYHPNTAQDAYPFRAVVTNAGGSFAHYGDWPVELDLGSNGVFYWEHEEKGSNNGYHLYAVGTAEGAKRIQRSTLCQAHDDDGVITDYGYGYFAKTGEIDDVKLKLTGIGLAGQADAKAGAALKKTMPGFTFVAYRTGVKDGLYLSDATGATSGQMQLSYNGYTSTYQVSPFFAAAIAYKGTTNPAGQVSADAAPGTKGNQFQIRNDEQLQYINWNSATRTTAEYLHQGTNWFKETKKEDTTSRTATNVVSFPYLGYAYASGSRTVEHHAANYYWSQTHDVDADMPADDSRLFTPLGSLYDSNWAATSIIGTPTSYVYAAYFNGSYEGQGYTVKNLQISSPSQSVGLFGIAVGAKVDGLVLYSDKGNAIRAQGGQGWYNLGGMAGMALAGGSSISGMANAGFTNCSVSGYTVRDSRSNHGYGGANVGGFSGLCNLSLSNCTAVGTVDVAVSYSTSSRNVRTGGMVGNFRGTALTNCYVGGSVSTSTGSTNTKIHVGGMVGGWFMRTAGNLESLFGDLVDKPQVKNCYTYADLSPATSAASRCPVVTNCNNENRSNNFTVTNCYYYAPKPVSYISRTVDGAATSVTFDQLSDQKGGNMAARLGSGWGWVTTTEGKASIPGKYSFHAGVGALAGKNYPFPTILSQVDQTGIQESGRVNVHYGVWPIVGLAWEQGEASVDILRDLKKDDRTVSTKGSAPVTFELTWNGDSNPPAKVQISAQRADGTAVDAGVKTPDLHWTAPTAWKNKKCTLTVYPRRTGTYTITAQTDSDSASFTLAVTASLTASVTPDQLDLAPDQTATVTLKAVSDAKPGAAAGTDLTTLATWKAAYDEGGFDYLFSSSLYKEEGHQSTGIDSDLIENYQDKGSATLIYTCTFNYDFDGTSSAGSTEGEEFTSTCELTVAGHAAAKPDEGTIPGEGEGTDKPTTPGEGEGTGGTDGPDNSDAVKGDGNA